MCLRSDHKADLKHHEKCLLYSVPPGMLVASGLIGRTTTFAVVSLQHSITYQVTSGLTGRTTTQYYLPLGTQV